jgi:uncharacterized protein
MRAKMLSWCAMPLDFALFLLFFATVVPWLGRRRIRLLMNSPQTEKRDRLILYASTILFQWAAVGVIAWRTRAHHITSGQLALAVPNLEFVALISAILCLLVFSNQLFSLRRLSTRPDEIRSSVAQLAMKLFPQDNTERAVFLLLSATVALCEEFIYRGFAQGVLQNWSANRMLEGILGSAALFALAHLYQGPRGLFSTFVVGILFAGIRAWTGSLLPAVLAHFVADSSAGILAPASIRRGLQAVSANILESGK